LSSDAKNKTTNHSFENKPLPEILFIFSKITSPTIGNHLLPDSQACEKSLVNSSYGVVHPVHSLIPVRIIVMAKAASSRAKTFPIPFVPPSFRNRMMRSEWLKKSQTIRRSRIKQKMVEKYP